MPSNYTHFKKNVLVFSKPQIFEKQIEMFSSSSDGALLGQLEESKEEVSGSGAGLRGGHKETSRAGVFSCRQGCAGVGAVDCVCVCACVYVCPCMRVCIGV